MVGDKSLFGMSLQQVFRAKAAKSGSDAQQPVLISELERTCSMADSKAQQATCRVPSVELNAKDWDTAERPSTRHPSDVSTATEVAMETDWDAVRARQGFADEAERPLPAAVPFFGAIDPYAGASFELLLNGRYRVLRDLARGESGQVQHAIDLQTGQDVAIKLIDRTRKLFDPRVVARELQNQHLCAAHPHIVQLREVFVTPQHLAIVMDYASGGDLAHYVDALMQHTGRGIPEPQARALFQQLMVAVDFCHRLGIANRDIKLDNMMLNGGCELKMCDFGFSKDVVGQSTCKSSCGTPEYIAPELLFQGKYDGKHADVWSCGVSLCVLLTGRFPFSWPEDIDPANNHVKRMQKMFARITAGDYMPLPEVSWEAQDLIARMLQPNPDLRATTADVMRHPWFAAGMPRHLACVNTRLLTRTAASVSGDRSCRQTSGELARLVSECKLYSSDPSYGHPGFQPRTPLQPQTQYHAYPAAQQHQQQQAFAPQQQQYQPQAQQQQQQLPAGW